MCPVQFVYKLQVHIKDLCFQRCITFAYSCTLYVMELYTWLMTQKSHCPQSRPYSVHVRKHTLNRRTCKIYLPVNKEKWVLFWKSIQCKFTWETRHGHKYIVCLPRDVLWVQTPVKPWNNLDLQRTRIDIHIKLSTLVWTVKRGTLSLATDPFLTKAPTVSPCLSVTRLYLPNGISRVMIRSTHPLLLLFLLCLPFLFPSSFPPPGGEGPVTELFKTAPPLPKKSRRRLVFYNGGAFGGAFWY